jgi:hypothetical protein
MAYEMLGRKLEGKSSHGSYRCRWGDNIKIYFGEILYEGGIWVKFSIRPNGRLL